MNVIFGSIWDSLGAPFYAVLRQKHAPSNRIVVGWGEVWTIALKPLDVRGNLAPAVVLPQS
ncbi:hypothetical protein QWJ07_13450 [Frankia sp. RB7]|nr:hypothetical protein [Frankia sp. RB7]